MHILIYSPTTSAAEKMQAILNDIADHYTLAVTWSEVAACLEDGSPDLILVERDALTRLEPTTMLNLMESDRWPPLIFVDRPDDGVRDGVVLAERLAQATPAAYRVGELVIDTRKKRAGFDEQWVTLPPLQYRLLVALAQRAGEVVSHRELLRAVWGCDGSDREARELLKVHIRQIRRRLRLDPEEHPYIRSVRGFGYMLAPPEER